MDSDLYQGMKIIISALGGVVIVFLFIFGVAIARSAWRGSKKKTAKRIGEQTK